MQQNRQKQDSGPIVRRPQETQITALIVFTAPLPLTFSFHRRLILVGAKVHSDLQSASGLSRFRKEAMNPPGTWTYWVFPYAGAVIADAFRAFYARLRRVRP